MHVGLAIGLILAMMACSESHSKDAASDARDAGSSSSASRSNEQRETDRAATSDMLADASRFDGASAQDAADGGGDAALVGSAGRASGAGGSAGASGAGGMSDASLGAGGGDCGKCPPLTMNQAGFFGASCCTSPGNECGVSFLEADCIALNQPGVLDPACPDEVIALLLTVTLPGCCRPDGQCGVFEPDGFDLNVGCVRRDTKVIPGEVRRDLIPCTPPSP